MDIIGTDGQRITSEENKKENESLFLRRGKVFLPLVDVLLKPDASGLQAIFSNFFPVAIIRHSIQVNEMVEYHGLSPHFREVGEGERIPEYLVWLTKKDDGKIVFEKMEEVKK